MRYYDLQGYLESNKIKELQSVLLSGKKNSTVKMLRDYYNGEQWLYNSWMTDTTRSGKKVWNVHKKNPCLLYTSDAADDLLCVDLGGRRIIKKKKTTLHTRLYTISVKTISNNPDDQ